MKLKEVINYIEILKDIIDNQPNVSSVMKFKFLGTIKQFTPYIENFELIRNELIMKYGEEKETGGYEVVKESDNYKIFADEISKVLDQDIDQSITKFKAEDIMNAGISANYLIYLYDLIEE